MTIDITKIRAANTGTDLAANIHPATILAMCDEIERLRKDAEKYRLRVEIAQAQIDRQMESKE